MTTMKSEAGGAKDMTTKNTKAVSRRGVLRFAGIGIGVADAPRGIVASKSDAGTEAKTTPPAMRAGYRETEHVKAYYALAEI